MKIEAFKFDEETYRLTVLDQTLLPLSTEFRDISGTQDGFLAIKNMLVRGAPCIAAVGCLSLIVELNNLDIEALKSTYDLIEWLRDRSNYLIGSRPTAVNLKQALRRLDKIAEDSSHLDKASLRSKLTQVCIEALDQGQRANRRLGEYGARKLISNNGPPRLRVLTHCNTGALATVGHGTALGVIRTLHELGKLERSYCTETRPYNQGSRLTAWELVQEDVPVTLIADSMVAYLMASQQIDAVVVGADRVAANGDTANKIGTLQVAVVAKHYGVPFYVAAPTQSIDMEIEDASTIVIEQRPSDELRKLGKHQLAPADVDVWNPCFDVTPSSLIDGIITEFGVCKPEELTWFMKDLRSSKLDDALF